MLIQVSSPRPILNLAESPQHIRIHTLRRTGISRGEVFLNMNTDVEHGTRQTAPVEPYDIFPIDGEANFEGVEYYLPFDVIFGTRRVEYNESEIASNQRAGLAKRVTLGEKKGVHAPRDTMMALHSASGYSVIAKSAYRAEGSTYEERIFNFQLFFPVTGGGIIRVVGSPVDITNPTFDPKAVIGKRKYENITLRDAFNRTHRLPSPDIEDRKRSRIAAAEASMRADTLGLPPKSDR